MNRDIKNLREEIANNNAEIYRHIRLNQEQILENDIKTNKRIYEFLDRIIKLEKQNKIDALDMKKYPIGGLIDRTTNELYEENALLKSANEEKAKRIKELESEIITDDSFIAENKYLKEMINTHKEFADLCAQENLDLKKKIGDLRGFIKRDLLHSEGIEQLATTVGCIKTIWRNSLDNLLTIINK